MHVMGGVSLGVPLAFSVRLWSGDPDRRLRQPEGGKSVGNGSPIPKFNLLNGQHHTVGRRRLDHAARRRCDRQLCRAGWCTGPPA